MADSKKLSFIKPQILNIFCQNYLDWSLSEWDELMLEIRLLYIFTYSRVQNSIERLFWAGNQGNHPC